MSLLPFCQWLAETPGSIALKESFYMYPLVESAHVLTLCLFLGMAIMFDLRLLGVTLASVPMSEIRKRLGPWMAAGFVVMVITGVMLFYAIPVRSYQSIFFRTKVVALVLVGLNAFVFHSGIDRRLAEWRDKEIANRIRILKITLWASVIVGAFSLIYSYVKETFWPSAPKQMIHDTRPDERQK